MSELKVLQEEWRRTIEGKGGRCPCCNRWGKIYPRHINATMARSLSWLVAEADNTAWVDIPNTAPRWLVRSNQLPTLRWWELVERAATDDKDKKFSGMWRPTAKGIAFANGTIAVPRTVYTYDGNVVEYGEDRLYIHECRDKNFSYAEVMES
jgi:hypothetical protein